MNKFWTILLKILIVISFVGIVAFTGIAIFKNQNISFEAYSYIVKTSKKTDFKTVQNNIEQNVKSSYGSEEKDSYALYFNKAITVLNEGINYFVDYLVFEDELTKGEQDKLINLYDDYIEGFASTNKAYLIYKDTYDNINPEEVTDYARSNINAKGVALVREYSSCYEKGSKFFKLLVEIVHKYNQNSSNLFSFKEQIYMIKVGLVDCSLDFVEENMAKKFENKTYNKQLETSNDAIKCLYVVIEKEDNFSDADILTNILLENFVDKIKTLDDIYKWTKDNTDTILDFFDPKE